MIMAVPCSGAMAASLMVLLLAIRENPPDLVDPEFNLIVALVAPEGRGLTKTPLATELHRLTANILMLFLIYLKS